MKIIQMASFSPGSVAVAQVCTAILGTAHCWELRTQKIHNHTCNGSSGGTPVFHQPYQNSTTQIVFVRTSFEFHSLKTYDLRSYPQSQKINLRPLP